MEVVQVYSVTVADPHSFDALRELCARLRAPDGCPWDREQTLETLRTYVIEEAYEVVEAMAGDRPDALAAELGDLLFQIVFVARIAEENGWFDVLDVCGTVRQKMITRHPHVFGDVQVSDAAEVVRNWETIKQDENGSRGALSGVPQHLPALLKALRITEKAAALGFDWERATDVIGKLEEEVAELVAELRGGLEERQEARVQEEFGDVLFVLANLARKLGVDPEVALQGANRKFAGRFAAMEELARRRGMELKSLDLEGLDELWDEVKRAE